MPNYHNALTLPLEQCDNWNNMLGMKSPVLDCGTDETIDSLFFNFGDGYEVDIHLRNSESGPYIDAILFQDGCEVMCLEPGFESVEGIYSFRSGDDIIEVQIEHENCGM